MPHQSKFLTPLKDSPQDDGKNWVLTDRLKFEDEQGGIHVVPTGFQTDYASIPPLSTIAGIINSISFVLYEFVSRWHGLDVALLWTIGFSSLVTIISYSLTNCLLLEACGALHDYYYRVIRGSRGYADWLLWQAMKSQARLVPPPRITRRPHTWFHYLDWLFSSESLPFWKRLLVWGNVRLFGWKPWYDNGRVAATAKLRDTL